MRPEHIEEAIDRAHKLESLLRVTSLALEGEQVAGAGRLERVGGGAVLDLAADMARQILDGLDRAKA